MSNALDRAVAVMDRLYSPGGCPWDRQQTHVSLVPYLLEEAHELAEAIETGDSIATREELGDVLLQVLFHARIAGEEPQPYTVDDVATELADKLIRRHPHVFADQAMDDDPHVVWDRLKKAEKHRSSVLEGITNNQGALARAQKVVARARRAGLGGFLPAAGVRPSCSAGEASGVVGWAAGQGDAPDPAARIGRELFYAVVQAQDAGIDAEAALRGVLRAVERSIAAAEAGPRRPA